MSLTSGCETSSCVWGVFQEQEKRREVLFVNSSNHSRQQGDFVPGSLRSEALEPGTQAAALSRCVPTALLCEADLPNLNAPHLKELFHFCWLFNLGAEEPAGFIADTCYYLSGNFLPLLLAPCLPKLRCKEQLFNNV